TVRRFTDHPATGGRQIATRDFAEAGQLIAARVSRVGPREKRDVRVAQALFGDVGDAFVQWRRVGKAYDAPPGVVLIFEFEPAQRVQQLPDRRRHRSFAVRVKLAEEDRQEAIRFVTGTDQKPVDARVVDFIGQTENLPAPQTRQCSFAPVFTGDDRIAGKESDDRLILNLDAET